MRTVFPLQADAPTFDARSITADVAPAHAPARRVERAHRLIARVLLGGLALQLFFAGLGVFGVTTFLPHAILGTLVVLASWALPLIAWRGHLQPAPVRLSWLLTGLMMLQGLLIDLGRLVPAIAALHPVNAMLLVLVTYTLARRDI